MRKSDALFNFSSSERYLVRQISKQFVHDFICIKCNWLPLILFSGS